MPNIPEKKEVRWREIRQRWGYVWRVAGRFRHKGSAFFSRVRPSMICMKNDFSPVTLWVEPNRYCKDIVTVALAIKRSALWEGFDETKSQWIPYNFPNHFLVLGRVSRPFRQFPFWSKPDLLMIRGKIEPRLIKGYHKLPIVAFDELERAQ
jgi:hypothetical protein